jgi:hypothetical protein
MFRSSYIFNILVSIICLSSFVLSTNYNNHINNPDGNNPNIQHFPNVIDQNGNSLLGPDGKQLNINEILKKLQKETEKNGNNLHVHQFAGSDGKPIKQIPNNDPEHQKNLNKILNMISQQNIQKNEQNKNGYLKIKSVKDPKTSLINNYIVDGEGNHILVEAFNDPNNNINLQNEQNGNKDVNNKDGDDLLFYYQPVREDVKTLVNFNNSNSEHTISLYWTSQFNEGEDVFIGDILPMTSLSVSTFINHVFYATRFNSKLTREFPPLHRIIENIETYSFKPVMIVENVPQEVKTVNLQSIEGLEYM